MANLSIKNAFSRMHQHIVNALNGKVDKAGGTFTGAVSSSSNKTNETP